MGPDRKRIQREGPESPGGQARIRRIFALSRADAVKLYLIAYDMVVKPEFGDVGAILLGLATATVLAGLLVWHGLTALAVRTP